MTVYKHTYQNVQFSEVLDSLLHQVFSGAFVGYVSNNYQWLELKESRDNMLHKQQLWISV